jgi:hypothetical protein
MASKEKWIGTARVRSAPGEAPLGPGVTSAHVNVVALAASAEDFEAVAREALAQYGFVLLQLDDVDLLAQRVRSFEVDPVLIKDVEQIPGATNFVFGSFHSYREEPSGRE